MDLLKKHHRILRKPIDVSCRKSIQKLVENMSCILWYLHLCWNYTIQTSFNVSSIVSEHGWSRGISLTHDLHFPLWPCNNFQWGHKKASTIWGRICMSAFTCFSWMCRTEMHKYKQVTKIWQCIPFSYAIFCCFFKKKKKEWKENKINEKYIYILGSHSSMRHMSQMWHRQSEHSHSKIRMRSHP